MMAMIAIRIHSNGNERLLAACDEELLGNTYREGEARLTVSEIFYKAEVISEEVLAERMKSVTMMNLVGDRAISVAISEGHVSETGIITIQGVKHAQSVIS